MSAAKTALAKTSARTFVPIADIRPDPDQPRKHFDEAKLKELAESIREQGVVCDLIVRYRPGIRVAEPDMIEKNWRAIEEGSGTVLLAGSEKDARAAAKGKEQGFYQIGDGERRWRAAQLLGLKELPIAVRQFDDKAKLVLQVITNQQREALTALEEAASYDKAIKSGQHTIESLYKSLGVSRGTLFARLVLNRLHPPVRAALETGKISVSVAGLVAMVPELKAQEQLLEELTDETHYKFPWSFRDVQEHIEEEYCKALKDAPFDINKEYNGEFKDAQKAIVMLHLRGACKGCRFRSGNIEGSGTKNLNVCTQPLCFTAKSNAAWKEKADKAQADGRHTIDAAQWAKAKGRYILPGAEEWMGGKYRSWKDAMGASGKKVERVLAQTPEGVREVILKDDAKAAAKKNGVKIVDSHVYAGSGDYAKEEAKRKAKIQIARKAVDWARPLVVARLGSLVTREAWQLVARWVFKRWEYNLTTELKAEYKKVPKFTETEVRQWLLEALYCGDDGVNYKGEIDDAFELICEQCGIDVKKQLQTVRKEAEAAEKTEKPATPPPEK